MQKVTSKAYAFVIAAIGKQVWIANHRDAAMDREIKSLVIGHTPLTVLSLSSAGMAIVQAPNGRTYKVRPKNLIPSPATKYQRHSWMQKGTILATCINCGCQRQKRASGYIYLLNDHSTPAPPVCIPNPVPG